ncbi:unnamed protein product [Prorocentrum cordatum]|uniref:Uncharacterized protein n=1 Tax=Prorocentrum cordatum TaxID=2364126 RepID=A0ABN9QUV4_9DINO|nr:unnamed protein product [Polarella glacialis]
MAAFRSLVLFGVAHAAAGLKEDPLPVHNLTVCNAYADARPLTVYTLSKMAKLTEEPLKYKECRLIPMQLSPGERLDFKMAGLSVGTFRANGLPKSPANLVLVPYHHTKDSTTAAFASHAFSSKEEAQVESSGEVAVIDAYAGTLNGTLKIEAGTKKAKRIAEMKAGSQVVLPAGGYQIQLNDASDKRIQAAALEASDRGRYVVLRVGSEADRYAQELVVSSAEGNGGAAQGSGSLRAGLGVFAVAAAALSLGSGHGVSAGHGTGSAEGQFRRSSLPPREARGGHGLSVGRGGGPGGTGLAEQDQRNRTGRNRTRRNRTGRNKTRRNRTRQNRTSAEQGWAEQDWRNRTSAEEVQYLGPMIGHLERLRRAAMTQLDA